MKYYLKFDFQWAKQGVVLQDFRTQNVTFVRPFRSNRRKGMKSWNIILFLDTLRSVLRNLAGIFYNKRQYWSAQEKNWQWSWCQLYLGTSTYTEYLSEKKALIIIGTKGMFWKKTKKLLEALKWEFLCLDSTWCLASRVTITSRPHGCHVRMPHNAFCFQEFFLISPLCV